MYSEEKRVFIIKNIVDNVVLYANEFKFKRIWTDRNKKILNVLIIKDKSLCYYLTKKLKFLFKTLENSKT